MSKKGQKTVQKTLDFMFKKVPKKTAESVPEVAKPVLAEMDLNMKIDAPEGKFN